MTAPATSRCLFLALGVALIAGAVMLPGLPGDWVFDDFPNIVNNQSIQLHQFSVATIIELLSTPQPSGSLRSLPTLSFALDFWRAGGMDPATFKTTNIAIHAVTAFALVWLYRSLLQGQVMNTWRTSWLAAALALSWAIHPMMVSSVLYTVQRLQTMGTLFLVIALIAYLKARHAQIEGRSGRNGFLLSALALALALGSKEDSALLPAYTLTLELTVLRFAANDAALGRNLKRGYTVVVGAGALIYLFWVAPHYWSWEDYSGRDFSTLERLLTQPRLLCLYLWQIVWPLPSHLPFYYDWVIPSRNVFHPWTTLPATGLIIALLTLAWHSRHTRPLMALGILWFFAAHFITSNVIGLELAFEHRNHFALIGAVLTLGSLLADLCGKWRPSAPLQVAFCVTTLLALAGATLQRAHSWSSAMRLAEAGTVAAPQSPRAWIDLCSARFDAGGGATAPHNPNLDAAIDACRAGAEADTESLNNLAKLIALKSLRGDVVAHDWADFQQRLSTVRMSWDNARAPLVLTHYASLGVKLDSAQVLQALATLADRAVLKPITLAQIGLSVLEDLDAPDAALTYFNRAVIASQPGDPLAWQIAEELRTQGQPEMATAVERTGHLHAQSKADRP